MARAVATPEKVVNLELTAKAFAYAVYTGDFVNFRFLFSSLSPVRSWTSQVLETEKYSYLLPKDDDENDSMYQEAYKAVKNDATWAFITNELKEKRPAQLPAELVLLIADNAVRSSKFTIAAQAYELLRLRRKMQAEFFKHADEALSSGNIPKAVQGYRITTGLAYDYSAFPEPLPKVANHQGDALRMHGRYPNSPEECLSVLPEEEHTNLALGYLLGDGAAANRLREYPLETRLAFVKELVRRMDPQWDTFVERYRKACTLVLEFADRMQHKNTTLEDEIDEQQGHVPTQITEALLGRTIENGEWWQYLKDLAYEHPAAILFIARQRFGNHEILMPRLRGESSLPAVLGLAENLPEGA